MASSRTSAPAVTVPERLPILPLVHTVVFPAGVAALELSGSRARAIGAAVRGEGEIVGIFYPEHDTVGDVAPADLHATGVAARVVQRLRLDERRLQILCRGLCRLRLEAIESTEPHLVGRVTPIAPPVPDAGDDELIETAITAYADLAAAGDSYRAESVEMLRTNAGAGADFFADLLSSLVAAPIEVRRKLVAIIRPGERLAYLLELLGREADRQVVERQIRSRAEDRIDEARREHLLREQLRTIQAELGDSHVPRTEAEQYQAMIEDLPLDDDSKSVIERECEALSVMSVQSAEYPAQIKYLDTLFRLPWWEKTTDSLDLRRVERLLSRRHYGLDEVKERLLEYLSVIKLKGRIAGPILCLAGPPGTGKTTLGRSIAEAFGRKFASIRLGGVSDESEIRGHRKTYVGAMPGKIVSAYDRVGSRNPVLLLDEIDKLSRSLQGDPAAALLEVLDPEQNRTYVDRFLGVPFDLSETLFVTTANLLDAIPSALRDRLEVLRLSGYTEEEKIEIARRFMRPKLLAAHGLEAGALSFSSDALAEIVRGYTAEAGVRELERQLAAICRKVARRRALQPERPAESLRIGVSDVAELLGPPRYEQEFAGRNPEVGVATGLAWTGDGGAILFIEASRMPGSGKIEVTGHLGEVMNESVRTAYSYVRAHSRELRIAPETIRNSDVHIHFPAGSIPKDGPSAGLAAATCLASLLSGRPVRHDVAMSGEVTLRGKLLSVGGIQEKLLAARRSRIRTVLLPVGNHKDLERVPESVKEPLEVVLVRSIREVWERALVPLELSDEPAVELLEPGRAREAGRLAASDRDAD